ncbi:conserved hypothetical protein [Xenorhabdus nematophila F1]|nr:conserved hypothetical protein [Xenorhabdus nematophila F1]
MLSTFELLATLPWIGGECDWVCAGMRHFELKKHSIYYNIFILRVIYQSMDVDILDFPE